MNIVRVTARAYGRYRLITYGCETCGMAYTEGEPDGEKPGPSRERE